MQQPDRAMWSLDEANVRLQGPNQEADNPMAPVQDQPDNPHES